MVVTGLANSVGGVAATVAVLAAAFFTASAIITAAAVTSALAGAIGLEAAVSIAFFVEVWRRCVYSDNRSSHGRCSCSSLSRLRGGLHAPAILLRCFLV